jgi:hypothetical protein
MQDLLLCAGRRTRNPSIDETWQEKVQRVLQRLSENERRWVSALLAEVVGWGGEGFAAHGTGLDLKTVRVGRSELEQGLGNCPSDRIRRPGAGRRPVEKRARPRTGVEANRRTGNGRRCHRPTNLRQKFFAFAGRSLGPGFVSPRRSLAEKRRVFVEDQRQTLDGTSPSRPRSAVSVSQTGAGSVSALRGAPHPRRHEDIGSDRELSQPGLALLSATRDCERSRCSGGCRGPGDPLRNLNMT